MNAPVSLNKSLLETLQSVGTAVPTVFHYGGYLDMDGHLDLTTTNYSHDFGNDSTIRNGTSLEDQDNLTGSSQHLYVRLLVVAAILVGIVLMTMASYTIHRRYCNDGQKHKYQRATLVL